MIESGWWRGLQREERTCRECQAGRWRMLPIGCLNVMGGAPNTSLSYIQAMRHITNNFDNLCEDDKLVLDLVLNKGYQHFSILKNIIRMWTT